MRLRPLRLLLPLTLAACARGAASPLPPPRLEEQTSGTRALLQAVSAVDTSVVWVSGHGGAWARTTDGGRSWRAGGVAGADSLEFRDVHALDATTAWLLSAGPGTRSRIYRTDDGGARWTLQWTNEEPEGFYDCFDFWDRRRGIAYGDAVDGTLRVLLTGDGGRSWRLVPAAALPPAQPGEGGFAASGSCVQTGAGGRAWIATGNAARARVLRSTDYGETWSAHDTPVVAGEGAGLTSVSMADERTGTVFGGDLGGGAARADAVARTEDGGSTWTLLPPLALAGAAYGGVHVPETDGRALVAVGPGGADLSLDGGTRWRTLDARAWWGVGSAGPAGTWITGPEGRIARVRLR